MSQIGDQRADFPILQRRYDKAQRRTSIPWALIGPHERQAERNHQQTLQRLAERGGLSPAEAVAVIEDRRWRMMDDREADQRLTELIADWELSQLGA